VIQGGDPDYKVGTFAMANAGPDTNGSQFFVVTGKNGPTILNSNPAYTDFGMVIEGLAVAQKLESFHPTEGSGDGPPTRDLYMFKVEITESA
jgi:peptidylprolyl isomerase/peptidyl-prolyl cis-trans isomerase B (cyclophilin B)